MFVKCSFCSNKAITKLRYAKLNLCSKHFVEYVEKRFSRIISKNKLFKNMDKVVVAVSGGKDSVTLLHLLHKVSKEFNFEIVGLTIDLGIRKYSVESIEKALKNYEMLNIKYKIIELKNEYGFSVDDIVKYKRKAGIKKPICSICGTIKRYIMNKYALEIGANAVATGHNLDDMVYYIFSSLYSGKVDNLAKISIYSPSEFKFVAKVKPLAYISEKETLLYAILRKLPFNYDVCPYARLRTFHEYIRKTSNILEENIPGLKITFAKMFLEKINPILYSHYLSEKKFKECEICGMPTTGKICSFCKIKSTMGKVLKNDQG